ncbi:MAG: serine hydrolase domain-containing protein [Ignavibacteriaceae bacterium]
MKIKKPYSLSFNYQIFFCLVMVLEYYTSTNAQVNIEAIARLHFSLTETPNQWFEGYQSYRSGSYSPYQSHRSGSNRDTAFVARTSGSEAMIEWKTAVVPKTWKGDSASFIWVCGFGNNLGTERFDLTINDTSMVSFSTIDEGNWSVSGSKGITLSFTAVTQNANGANLGYMVLTLHNSLVVKGKALNLRIRGRIAEREIWYRLFAYRDAIKYAIENEKRNYYSSVEFIHMGDAALTFCAPKKSSGSTTQLYNANTMIAEGRLQPDDALSKTTIVIPRNLQPFSSEITIIKVAGKSVDTIFWNDMNKRRVRAFMEEYLECDRYVFPPGNFPKFRWKNEIMVENEVGKFPLKATYFNSDFQKVTGAGKPGRYGAMIEGVTATGFVIKRFVTLFCSKIEFDDYSKNVPLHINKLKGYGIPDSIWEVYSKNEERFSFGSLKDFPEHDADAAIFLAGLKDLENTNYIYDTPRIQDRQWWIKLKRKLEGNSPSQNQLSIPQKINNDNSIFLNDEVAHSVQYDKDKIEEIRNICRNWVEKGGSANVTLVVHKGKIIFHEAFGVDEDGKTVTKDSRMWMASITKLLTGVLMMQFVDQGMVDLDKPIGIYLPELKEIASDKLTLRHLFTHTSGLQFAGEWASDWNYDLENQIAQVLPTTVVGGSFAYNRVGYSLAGKIMERITGRAVPYLFQDNIFSPLGMKSAYSDNTYGGLYCSAIDLARLGQMLLNKGTYNGINFFSEQSFEKMLPQKLPVGNIRWGIGTSSMKGDGLSDSAFGHGAASGTTFRIDPKNDLIIISARNKPGKFHDEFESSLIKSCTSLVIGH